VLIADNVVDTPPPGMSGVDPSITIPAVRISLANGNAIKAELTGGATVNVTLGVDPSRYAGADTQGRALLNAPTPVQTGSSTSHFDPIAFRNLLMEPAINGDLTHSVKAPEDLTLAQMRDIGWFADADVDGYADDVDACDGSDLAPTVVIDGCDSGAPNLLLSTGCTISDNIAGFASSAGNHGEFVRAVVKFTNDLRKAGLLTDVQAEAIRTCAAESSIP